ncbi:MAG: thymidylate kinase, partial [bacterium]|nr:thymidylate kinase [bacterium]
YAVDRYASFKKDWEDFYCAGGTVICGRYVTSNAVHQASKLRKDDRAIFFEWLYDLEYNKVGIPKPDLVVFLDMPIDVSQKMLCGRYNGDDLKKDIHERDISYLNECREAALFAANYSGWKIVNCAKDGLPRTIDDIAAEILELVKKVL